MRQNKLIAMMAAFFAVCMTAGSAWAIDRVEVKVTSEPIPRVAQCSKAGGFSLEFDSKTKLTPNDVIKIDLPGFYNNTQVKLCKDIDFVVSAAGGVEYNEITGTWSLHGHGWGTNVPRQLPTQDNPFIFPDVSNPGPNATAEPSVVGDGIVFHVSGVKGGTRITIKVIANKTTDNLTVGTAGDAKLILKLFDLKDNGDFNNDGIYGPTYNSITKITTYDALIDGNDNALCIDVFGSPTDEDADTPKGEITVYKANMDSDDVTGNDKYTFIPSDPQIAHIAGTSAFEVADCKNASSVEVPKDQASGILCSLDYETATSNQLIIKGNFDEGTNYGVRLGIVSPSNAYWAGNLSAYKPVNSSATCGGVDITGAAAFTKDIHAYKSNLSTLVNSFAGNNCTVSTDQEAKYVTANGATVTTLAKNGLWIDVPRIAFNGTVKEGDKLEISVTLMKEPCGEIDLGTVTLVTFGSSEDKLLFPYFTSMSTDNWWDGFVITNLSEVAGKATIYVYEQDGDQGKLENISVNGNSLYITLLSAIADSFTLTKTGTVAATSGTLGNSPCYIKVETEFNADGFAMMGDGTQAQGYLPRDLVNDLDRSSHDQDTF